MLSLVMIVKNEAASIEKVLEAAKPYIDRWTILDTGSTDGTQELIKKALDGVPGQLFEESFEGFAKSRNRVMELDRQAEARVHWQFMLSGDEFLVAPIMHVLFEDPSDGAPECLRLKVTVDKGESFYSPRIFWSASEWHYEDAGLWIHEFPTHSNANAPIGDIHTLSIAHDACYPFDRLQNIADVHIPLLEEKLEEQPENPRALVFLAQSYESLFSVMQPWERLMYAMACLGLYQRRFALPFANDAERNYLRFRFLFDARYTQVYSPDEIYSRALELAKEDPKRPDVHLLLCHAAAATGKVSAAQMYELAANAVKVAQQATTLVNSSPVSGDCLWKAHMIAAKAAKVIAMRNPGARRNSSTEDGELFEKLAKEHVHAGLAAGGKFEHFQAAMGDANAEPDFQQAPVAGVIDDLPPAAA
jgi:glycosyltransferase involved in cell wall biosynthesis